MSSITINKIEINIFKKCTLEKYKVKIKNCMEVFFNKRYLQREQENKF